MGLGPQIADIVNILRTTCGDTTEPAFNRSNTNSRFDRNKNNNNGRFNNNNYNNNNNNYNNKDNKPERPAGTHVNRPTGTHLNSSSSSTPTPAPVPEPEKPKLNKTTKFEYDDGYVPKKEVVLIG